MKVILRFLNYWKNNEKKEIKKKYVFTGYSNSSSLVSPYGKNKWLEYVKIWRWELGKILLLNALTS